MESLTKVPFISDILILGVLARKSHTERNKTELIECVMLKAEVSGINTALEQLYKEISSNEVRMLCTTLQHSINFGSSIYKMLIDLGKEIRNVQLLDMEEKWQAYLSK
ncbi:MAG: hypothetical protein ACR5LD_03690 [Symbiopectobacterium sp.]